MRIPLYELIFDDFVRYQGGDISKPLWRDAPDKAILHFKLKLPNGDFLLLEGYEEYNFFVEVMADVSGKNISQRLTYMYVLGCKNEIVTSYRIALGDYGQYKAGDMTVRNFPKGKEYNDRPTLGWHKGKIWQL